MVGGPRPVGCAAGSPGIGQRCSGPPSGFLRQQEGPTSTPARSVLCWGSLPHTEYTTCVSGSFIIHRSDSCGARRTQPQHPGECGFLAPSFCLSQSLLPLHACALHDPAVSHAGDEAHSSPVCHAWFLILEAHGPWPVD